MFFLYFAIKFIAYYCWCTFGMSYLRLDYSRRMTWGLLFGSIRLLMGLFFGVVIWIVSSSVYSGYTTVFINNSEIFYSLFTYVSVYIPIRWIEWSLMEIIMNRNARTLKHFWWGANQQSRSWRLGGILISCLADLPVIITIGGLPIGRFMC